MREVLPVSQEDIFFPLRQAYEQANYTLEGIEEHLGKSRNETNYDLPPLVTHDPRTLHQAQPNDNADGKNKDHYEDDTNFILEVQDTTHRVPNNIGKPTSHTKVNGERGRAESPATSSGSPFRNHVPPLSSMSPRSIVTSPSHLSGSSSFMTASHAE